MISPPKKKKNTHTGLVFDKPIYKKIHHFSHFRCFFLSFYFAHLGNSILGAALRQFLLRRGTNCFLSSSAARLSFNSLAGSRSLREFGWNRGLDLKLVQFKWCLNKSWKDSCRAVFQIMHLSYLYVYLCRVLIWNQINIINICKPPVLRNSFLWYAWNNDMVHPS